MKGNESNSCRGIWGKVELVAGAIFKFPAPGRNLAFDENSPLHQQTAAKGWTLRIICNAAISLSVPTTAKATKTKGVKPNNNNNNNKAKQSNNRSQVTSTRAHRSREGKKRRGSRASTTSTKGKTNKQTKEQSWHHHTLNNTQESAFERVPESLKRACIACCARTWQQCRTWATSTPAPQWTATNRSCSSTLEKKKCLLQEVGSSSSQGVFVQLGESQREFKFPIARLTHTHTHTHIHTHRIIDRQTHSTPHPYTHTLSATIHSHPPCGTFG